MAHCVSARRESGVELSAYANKGGQLMEYSFRVHILGYDEKPGHAFIELRSPTGSQYYELTANENFQFSELYLYACMCTTGNCQQVPRRRME
jgi:hypothetical protein